MYKELQRLRTQSREAHNFDIPSYSNLDVDNYMTIDSQTISNLDIALLDSTSTHTILTNPKKFSFPHGQTSWQTCKIITIAGSRNMRFQKGRAMLVLPGGFPLTCEQAMYAPDAPCSLIIYRDLNANKIHVSTALKSNEEVLELRQG